MTLCDPKTGAPARYESIGKMIRVYPREVGIVAGNLRVMAHEMKAAAGPWPSAQFQARLDLLDLAARYLSPRPMAKASDLRKRAVAQYAQKRKRVPVSGGKKK